MNIADLTQSYSGKTDEELLRLAEQRQHLTIEAQSALASELSRRRIAAPPSESARPASPLAPRTMSVVIAESSIKTGAFIEEVLRFYARNRWVLNQLIFPAVFLGFVAISFAHNEAHAAAEAAEADLLKYGLPLPPLLLLKLSLISASGYIASWIIFAFRFLLSVLRSSKSMQVTQSPFPNHTARFTSNSGLSSAFRCSFSECSLRFR